MSGEDGKRSRGLRRGMVLMALMVAGCGQGAPQPAATGSQAGTGSPATLAPVAGPERRILAVGDSLFAGYGLTSAEAYPVRLEAALRAGGINARVANASVSGDTTADGAGRLAFALDAQPRRPDLVILCLGGNDMLRGLPPRDTEANLERMLAELDRRHIKAMLMGMLAAPNLGRDYAGAFDPIYPRLARRHHAALVPFFLAAVIDRPELRQADHIHPTHAGVEALVAATLPDVRKALARS